MKLDLKDIAKYVEDHIGEFHAKRLKKIRNFKLKELLKRKNPYLLKAKNILTAHELISEWLDAYLSSQEEAIFGGFLEELAIYICGKVYGGRKSSTEGIDLEVIKEDIEYLVTIKSGPDWANSSQIAKMKDHFTKAKRIRRTNASKKNINIVAINGCCYGRDNRPDKGEYQKLCGAIFWEFISGDPDLYQNIIEPLGHKAKEKNEEFAASYAQTINTFTEEFMREFCNGGKINWEKLVAFSSSKEVPVRTRNR